MKARLRKRLPRRFQRAVILARRGLHCERLESRCLLHGMPLAGDYQADQGVDQNEYNQQPYSGQPYSGQPYSGQPAALVHEPATEGPHSSPSGAYPAPEYTPEEDHGDPSSSSNSDLSGESEDRSAQDGHAQSAPNASADGSEGSESTQEPDLAEPPDGSGDWLVGEGEAAFAPAFAAAGSNGSFLSGSNSGGAGDVLTSARPTAPMGDAANSAPASPLATSASGQSSSAALSDHQSQTPLSNAAVTTSSNRLHDETVSSGMGNTDADRSTRSTLNSGMSLNSDVQLQSGLSENALADGDLSQSLQTDDGFALPSPWLFTSDNSVSALTHASWNLPAGQNLIEAMRSIDTDEDSELGAVRYSSDSAEEVASAYESVDAEESEDVLDAWRITPEQPLRHRKTERHASSFLSMRDNGGRAARASTLPAFLRVREGSDGMVELAIEQPSASDDYSDAYAVEEATAAVQQSWSDSAMGLYREFDLATATEKSSATALSNAIALSLERLHGSIDALDDFEAVDAAHAEGDAGDDAMGSVGEATLPLGLLALSSFLAISRHRYTRKLSQL